jgi:hypothetical protein
MQKKNIHNLKVGVKITTSVDNLCLSLPVFKAEEKLLRKLIRQRGAKGDTEKTVGCN